MDAEYSVTVVIVTRNRPQMTQECLEHLCQQTVLPEEIIVSEQ